MYKFLQDIIIKNLPNPCKVKGFNKKQGSLITQYTELILLINKRRLKVLFLIISLGDYDVILGRK